MASQVLPRIKTLNGVDTWVMAEGVTRVRVHVITVGTLVSVTDGTGTETLPVGIYEWEAEAKNSAVLGLPLSVDTGAGDSVVITWTGVE